MHLDVAEVPEDNSAVLMTTHKKGVVDAAFRVCLLKFCVSIAISKCATWSFVEATHPAVKNYHLVIEMSDLQSLSKSNSKN